LTARTTLETGVNWLKPTLEQAGFKYNFESEGNGSGGSFARASFASGNKKLEFSFRYSLGCVEYHIGNLKITHTEYMDATGHKKDARYPGYSREPDEAFKSLATDISKFCTTFLNGSEEEMVSLIETYNNKPKPRGFAGLSNNGT
jgi:hypothetical protein